MYKKNKVERGCVVARAAPGGAVRESSGFGCVQRLERKKRARKIRQSAAAKRTRRNEPPPSLGAYTFRVPCLLVLCCCCFSFWPLLRSINRPRATATNCVVYTTSSTHVNQHKVRRCGYSQGTLGLAGPERGRLGDSQKKSRRVGRYFGSSR